MLVDMSEIGNCISWSFCSTTMNFTTDSTEDTATLVFGWLDIFFFILMLALSTLIGVYFGFWGKKEDSPQEYLLGGKTMNTLPVAVSLVAR